MKTASFSLIFKANFRKRIDFRNTTRMNIGYILLKVRLLMEILGNAVTLRLKDRNDLWVLKYARSLLLLL